jgi:hypothetical protein
MSVATTTTTTPRQPRRTAFLVGINYINTQSELNGCYNDVVNVSQYLRSTLGYSSDAIIILTDGNRNSAVGTASALAPTRKNIIAGLTALVAGMVAGDEAFFHFSGHGTLARDTNNDEVSGFDSCLCPVDYAVPASADGGIITDDEIRTLLINRVPRGAQLYVVLDCCHNGTGCDIRYKYEDFSILQSPPSSGRAPVWQTRQSAFANPKYTNTAGEVFMISGCRDEQTSADAYINNSFAGALTHAVFAILRANQPNLRTYSWSALLRDVRHFMRVNRFSQIPQLMTGQLITPARAVFPRLHATTTGFRGGLTTESVNLGSRSISQTHNTTLFQFTPKSVIHNPQRSIGLTFIH